MSKYPEHEKLKTLDREHAAVQRFLDHLLDEHGYTLAKWGNGVETGGNVLLPMNPDRASLIASFLGVDRDALEREKRAMLEGAMIGVDLASDPDRTVDMVVALRKIPNDEAVLVAVKERVPKIPGVYVDLPEVEAHPVFDPLFYARIFGYDSAAVTAARAAQTLLTLATEVPFVDRTEARSECFMADGARLYTYGAGVGVRTYEATPFHPEVRMIMDRLNERSGTRYNVCVLNRYRDEHQSLGWHSDDSPEQDQSHPIAVVSFGALREIWTRRIGTRGEPPMRDRYLLTPGSVFVMPGGYQQTHQHRIPKPGRTCGLRISLTFRKLDR